MSAENSPSVVSLVHYLSETSGMNFKDQVSETRMAQLEREFE